MFLQMTILNRLLKQAYKTGLVVARSLDEEGRDWIYLAGKYWEAEIRRSFIPNKTMGDLITLVGELPGYGQRFNVTKEGGQMELNMPIRVDDTGFLDDTLTITDVVLLGSGGTAQRLLQDESTGQIYAINNVFVSMINKDMIEEDKGELAPGDPIYHTTYGVLWKNNVCKLRAHFRNDGKNDKVLEGLKGVDITPLLQTE